MEAILSPGTVELCKSGDVNSLKSLKKKKKLDIHGVDDKGNTLLHFCVQTSNIQMLDFLLDSKASPNTQNFDGLSPLHFAVETNTVNSVKIVQLLMQKRADAHLQTEEGEELVHRAAGAGNPTVLRYVIDNLGGNIDLQNRRGSAPIHYAARSNHLSVLKLLLQAQCDVNSQNRENDTPIALAAALGHTPILIALWDAGAIIGLENRRGLTPLHWGARYGRLSAVKELLRHMTLADIKKPDYQGNTALLWAQQGGHRETELAILEALRSPKKKFCPCFGKEKTEAYPLLT